MITAHRVGAAPGTRLYASTTRTYSGDLDYIAIEYAMNGDRVDLTPAERMEAARLLAGRGYDAAEIARRLGVNDSTVRDWRRKKWQVAAPRPDEEPIDIGDAKHGRSGYTKGCRCRICRGGAATKTRERRARLKRAAAQVQSA